MKILIIDDNVEIALVIRALLESEGYRVAVARDGNEGYVTYLDFKPDLVITDIQMPGKNGFQVMNEIRMHHPEIKTLYISGHATRFQSALEKEKKTYHADFLAKPFSRNELISLVSKNLGQGYYEGG